MYARAREELGHIDVLFNNAGISPQDDVSCSTPRSKRGSASRT